MSNTNEIINEYIGKLYSYKGCDFGAFSDKALVYDFIKEGEISFELEFIAPEGQDGLSGKFTNSLPETPISIYVEKTDAFGFLEWEIHKQINYLRDILSKQPNGVVCNLTLKYDDDIVHKKQFSKEKE